MIDPREYENPNPDDKRDGAAYELCRELGLRPLDLSERAGFAGDLELNWARWEIQKAFALAAAIDRATSAAPTSDEAAV